jgi:hypothetical protein
MNKSILISFILMGLLSTTACKKDKNCKECTGCKTLPTTTLCEDDFEKTSNYEDQVQNYESDGCNCKTK